MALKCTLPILNYRSVLNFFLCFFRFTFNRFFFFLILFSPLHFFTFYIILYFLKIFSYFFNQLINNRLTNIFSKNKVFYYLFLISYMYQVSIVFKMVNILFKKILYSFIICKIYDLNKILTILKYSPYYNTNKYKSSKAKAICCFCIRLRLGAESCTFGGLCVG